MAINRVSAAYYYSVSSIILGPAIGFFGLSRTSGGGDCYDAAYGSTVSFAQRDIEFQQAQLIMGIGGGVLLVIGLFLIGLLICDAIHTLREQSFLKYALRYILPLCLLLVMIAGYSFMLLVALATECEPVNTG